jgi:cellobiose-specific phosphotransferase system component IIA
MTNELTANPVAEALSSASTVATTGDARRLVLETMAALKTGSMAPDRGLAIAANMKVLNDSISAEINAAKMAIQAKKEGFEFAHNVQMGKRLIG